MISILDLPPEVSLHVFKQLLVEDAVTLLGTLQNESWPGVTALLTLVYQRLFGEGVSVVNTFRPAGALRLTRCTLLDIKSLPTMLRGSHPSNVAFRDIKSQLLELIMIRDARDNDQFFKDLFILISLLEEYKTTETSNVVDFFNNVPPVLFYLDGLLGPSVNPQALSVNALSLVINMAAKAQFAEKITSFTLIRTSMGNLYVEQWGKLLGEFTSITSLNLSNNRISLDALRHFVWPPNMKLLVLDGNPISQFTLEIVQQLPKSLERLQLMATELTEMGRSMPPTFKIASVLPNLNCLKLSYCPLLQHVEPDMFRNLTVLKFCLEVVQCPLLSTHQHQLEDMATELDVFDVLFNAPQPVGA